ncbi:hypothetical protein [Candidatus Liberibacter solanacearum]|nr:hypothetical protein [Candidatus Liberibacter solanacearum]
MNSLSLFLRTNSIGRHSLTLLIPILTTSLRLKPRNSINSNANLAFVDHR